MKPLVIFGSGEIAEVAHFYFTRDAGRKVEAFTLDAAYIKEERICGCPVVPFEDLATTYPPAEYDGFVAIGYSDRNRLREQKYRQFKEAGYTLASYVSSRACIWPGTAIGDNCFILELNNLQPFTAIGSNVVLWSGNHIGHHSQIGDHCFISSHVVVSGGVSVGKNCFIGVNATLHDHIRLGDRTVVGAGSVIARSLADDSLIRPPKSLVSSFPDGQAVPTRPE